VQCGKQINQYQAFCVPIVLFENVGGLARPYESCGMVVVLVDMLANCEDQLLNSTEDSVADACYG